MPEEYAVIDFETTGLCAEQCRVIEVAVAIVRDGKELHTFSQLMNPGYRIPFFITQLTGITHEMLRGKPSPEEVMPKLLEFVGDRPCVAHNASFDSRFYHEEMRRSGNQHNRQFLCTLMLSRRLICNSPHYNLGALASFLKLQAPNDGQSHRALYDVRLTVELLARIEEIVLQKTNGIVPDRRIYEAIMKKSKKTVWQYLDKVASGNFSPSLCRERE